MNRKNKQTSDQQRRVQALCEKHSPAIIDPSDYHYSRPVLNVNTGVIYPSVKAAAKKLGASSGTVTRNIRHGWETRGFRLRYVSFRDRSRKLGRIYGRGE